MIYPAKKDGWVGIILFVAGVGIIGVGIFMMYMLMSGVIPPAPSLLIAFFTVEPLIGVVLLWILLGSSYEITDADLIIRFGPFRSTTPLERIVEVMPTRKLVGRPGWGYALSLDRLDIRYRKANGKVSRLVLTISPADQTGFVRELSEAVPGLQTQEKV
jgi:Bacterial PH domain